ncbi:MAG: hypothetical protein PF445_10685 [Melioribacteraceae bacterium]|jgi:nucleoside-triphosphatase THEP1|nr:hypothetical protein [Melioribacteraceae bacterium]
MKKIQIITGKIRSGKTTYLKTLITSTKNVGGIIQPANGEERFFSDIKTKESRVITSDNESGDTFRLGRFIFFSESFTWARKKLNLALQEDTETIVVDEYGPLEFKGNGLEPVVSEIMSQIHKTNKMAIIVIRESLVDEFLQKFNLTVEEVEIIRIESV